MLPLQLLPLRKDASSTVSPFSAASRVSSSSCADIFDLRSTELKGDPHPIMFVDGLRRLTCSERTTWSSRSTESADPFAVGIQLSASVLKADVRPICSLCSDQLSLVSSRHREPRRWPPTRGPERRVKRRARCRAFEKVSLSGPRVSTSISRLTLTTFAPSLKGLHLRPRLFGN